MSVAKLETPDGGEVRVEDGTGRITSVEWKDGARNVLVKIDAEHLRDPVTGWLDTQDEELTDRVRKAEEHGGRIDYRVEVKARSGVDPAPLDQLGNRDKVRELAGIYRAGDKPPTDRPLGAPPPVEVAGDPTSNPGRRERSDHPTNRRQDRSGRNGHAAGPAEAPPERSRRSDGTPPPEPSAAQTASQRVEQGGTASAPGEHAEGRSIATEAKPWESHNTDGRLNIGSYEVQAALGMVQMAERVIAAHKRDLAELDAEADDDVEPDPPTIEEVAALARFLLYAADTTQQRITGRVDRMANSHTRARGAIRSALWTVPPPWGGNTADRQAWVGDLVDRATALLTLAVEFTENR